MSNKFKSKINHELNLKFDILPRHIRYWASHLHYITGVAIEIILVTLLAFLGLACQDLYCVQLKNKQRFPLALYLLLLSRSGSGKSTIFRLLKDPFAQQEREFENTYRAELKAYERKNILWEAEFEVLNRLYKKTLSKGEDTTETGKALEEYIGRKPDKPVRKIIITTNPTSEALAKAIGLEYQNKALFNDEATAVYKGSVFNNPALLNTYWCGDKITIDRASSESFVIENYVFSCFLMMQPQPYNNTSRQKRVNIRETGLQARTLMIDMEQITTPCIISDHYTHSESVLSELYSVITRHLKAGVRRRENDDELITLTLTPDAQELLGATSLSLQQKMKPGGSLYHYDDIGARIIEQGLRMAGIFQVSGDPDSTRELSDEEKILFWMESRLVQNGSYNFSRNVMIKNGPLSTRCSARLMPALAKLESKGKVQLYEEAGINYVKFTGSKMHPVELAEKTNTPVYLSGSLAMSKLVKPE
ncbi:DUF3987 domain-containing protein [Escherichia marmotae]|uniref:DUF3987 domain-containing protein n=1 Tax=Escherichia marmotae TaxID=1499973 RepID=UPI00164F80E7|nr:DUF3987 domain-containing protein [Escherichia marmotae]